MTAKSVAQVAALAAGDLTAAGLTWVGWDLSGNSGTEAALAVLLVAAPLGILVALHLPVWLARRVGRAQGVLHLGPGALDAAPRLERLVIDIDRTVTTGNLVVTSVQPLDPTDDRTLRWFAGALAHLSEDPVNRAIARLATRGRTTNFTEDAEFGIRGSVDRHPVRVGRADWLDPEAASKEGATVGVEVDLRPLGQISVADEVRPDSNRHLEDLRRSGVRPVLVSRAGEADVARIAELAGADEWHASTDPLTFITGLDGEAARTGWARVRTTAALNGDGPTCEAELMLPGRDGQAASVLTRDSSVGAIVFSLGLLRRAHAARRLALRVSVGCLVVLTPVAAAGLLNVLAAAALGLAVPLVVALCTVLAVVRQEGTQEV